MTKSLPPGLYQALVTRSLSDLLKCDTEGAQRTDIGGIDAADAPRILGRHVAERLEAALSSLPKSKGVEGQAALANELLEFLQAKVDSAAVEHGDSIMPPPRQLLALMDKVTGVAEAQAPIRPSIPLDTSALLVNGPRDLSVGPEIKKEIASADKVDLLVSFLKWQGLRILRPALAEFLERCPGRLRVLTTSYMGVTEQRVLDELLAMGAYVKVSYDTRRTRLHAKAWLFHRDSGFSTAIIGSSNISAQALLDGLEWNVRLSKQDNTAIVERFEGVFEQYWEEGEFEQYDAPRFAAAIKSESGGKSNRLAVHIDVRPYPFQKDILEKLQLERQKGHNRNLVVAATGTGKTIISALDFRALRSQLEKPSLLFVAHRREILKQSQDTFRIVLRDSGFGELLVGGHHPVVGKHVFASIQSLNSKRLKSMDPEFYDVVIVDEFHHAAAPTYDALLSRVKPKVLLGLTATPERTDGRSVFEWFDGRIAAELRLWNALEQELLCPFQYFGIPDGVDLRGIAWRRGRYVDADLDKVYTGNHARAKAVLRGVRHYVQNPQTMRAVGFCVSIAHAEFMAAQFMKAGISAAALTSKTDTEDRDAHLRKLAAGELAAIFTVDIFNEGVDVPALDTAIFLRPTESATLYLQQLGRGLRHSEKKNCLTVLDFVGRARREFRFDRRFRAILGGTRKDLERQVEAGFPTLPPGCSIHLEKTAQEIILENIRQAVGGKWKELVNDLKGIGRDADLPAFIRRADVDLTDLYGGTDKGWTRLRRDAGFETRRREEEEKPFARALGRLVHVNDHTRLKVWLELFRIAYVPARFDLTNQTHRLYLMLAASLDPSRSLVRELPDVLRRFLAIEPLREEAIALFELLADENRIWTRPDDLAFAAPLALHADYSLLEIMAALGMVTEKGKVLRPQAGVIWVERHQCDVFFITLDKAEKDYSPTTLYKDYPISRTLFHWESQSSTREASKTGQRYINHRQRNSHIVLFVRKTRKDARGETRPYTFMGTAHYIRHVGERPMSITWRLHQAMPFEMFEETKVAAG